MRCLVYLVLLGFVSAVAPGHIQAQSSRNSLQISGVVVDVNGSVVEGADVSLKQKESVLTSTSTDAQGRFDFSTDASTDLLIEVASAGFEIISLEVNVNSSFPLRFVLIPKAISEQVTIAATRTETSLSETPASVVQLNSTDLKTTAALTLDDALRQVAGFSLFRRSGSRTANPTAQGVSLRGTGASGASRALVLADGVPLNDPFGGWIYWDRVPRESISQVEILLGAASHLYGSSALGGVIDISSRVDTKNVLSLSTSYGNQNSPNASLFAAAKTGGWSGSLATEFFRTDGYVLVPENQRGLVDTAAATRNSTTNLRLQRQLGMNGKVFGTASFFGESRKNGTPVQTNRTHLRQFVVGANWNWEDGGDFLARIYGGTQVYDQNFSAISADRNTEIITRLQRVPAQVLGWTTQWSKRFQRRQTFVAGLEGKEVRGTSDEIAYTNGRATSFIGAGGRERQIGVYFEDLLRLSSRVFLNLGGRLDYWRNFAALSSTRPVTITNATTVVSFSDRTEKAFSPHASVTYRLNDRFTLLASMSRAFRAPTLNELYRSFRVGNVLTLANENLQAERLTGGEAGLRFNSSTHRIAFRGNFYWNDITRPIANVTLTTTPALITRQRQNLGRTRSRGLELHSDVKLNQSWNLTTSYLFADASVVEFPANVILEGLRLPQVPRHQFTFQTQYMNPSFATVGFQGRASSSQFDDDLNQFRLGSYFTLDASISRGLTERFEVFAAIENLFNQRYEVGKTPVTTLGPPLLIRGGFRLRLGG